MATFSRKKASKEPADVVPAPPSEASSQPLSSISTGHLLILNRILSATRGPYDVQELLDLLVKEIVDAHMEGRVNLWRQVWLLLTLAAWFARAGDPAAGEQRYP